MVGLTANTQQTPRVGSPREPVPPPPSPQREPPAVKKSLPAPPPPNPWRPIRLLTGGDPPGWGREGGAAVRKTPTGPLAEQQQRMGPHRGLQSKRESLDSMVGL